MQKKNKEIYKKGTKGMLKRKKGIHKRKKYKKEKKEGRNTRKGIKQRIRRERENWFHFFSLSHSFKKNNGQGMRERENGIKNAEGKGMKQWDKSKWKKAIEKWMKEKKRMKNPKEKRTEEREERKLKKTNNRKKEVKRAWESE